MIVSEPVGSGVMPSATVSIVASSLTRLSRRLNCGVCDIERIGNHIVAALDKRVRAGSAGCDAPVTIMVLRVTCIPVDCTLLLPATPFVETVRFEKGKARTIAKILKQGVCVKTGTDKCSQAESSERHRGHGQ